MNIRSSLLLLVIAIVVAVLGVSFWLTRDVLVATVDERETEKVASVARFVETLVAGYTAEAQLAARVLTTSDRLLEGLTTADPERGRAILASSLRPILREDQLDILEVADTTEAVRYRAHAPERHGDRADAWGVSEALRGKGSMVAHVDADGTSVLAIEPLRRGEQVVGAVIAGRRLDEAFIRSLGQRVMAELALVSRSRFVASSSTSAAQSVDRSAIEEAFQQKIPVFRDGPQGHAKVVYLPILIVDEAFVMMVQVDSGGAFAALGERYVTVMQWAGGILVLSSLLAFALLHGLLRPLRTLRARAERTAVEATGSAIATRDSDEIGSVVQVLDTLTQRLLSQNRELAQSRSDAQIASEAKSQFLSNMSHEIRTPLNGILGMTELLQATTLTPDQKRFCRAISASGQALHELLSDILDLSKIEAGKVQVESVDFDLGQMLADLVTAFSELAATRSNRLVAQIEIDGARHIRGDPTRLRQVLSNLLGNAIKFTEGGKVVLAVKNMGPRPGDDRTWLRFDIRDSGIGIAPDKLEVLFSPFTQADSSTTRRFGGTGLGLAISKHLVELLGGRIAVQSVPGEGTHFSFELGFAPAERSFQVSQPQASPVPRRVTARILLAEDNPVNQEVIRAMLGQAGAEVVVVENGELAVQALRRERFDVVLMDCQMPVLSGYEATELIRAEEAAGTRVPIIALTANAFAEDRARCLAVGMDDYLTKPVKWELLARTVKRWAVRGKRAGDADPEAVEASMSRTPVDADEVDGAPGTVLDGAALDALAGDAGVDAVVRIVRLFIDRGPHEMHALRASAERRDAGAYRTTAHALKSAGLAVGGVRFAALAREAEQLARAGDEAAYALIEGIEASLRELCAALNAHPLLRTHASGLAVQQAGSPAAQPPAVPTHSRG